MPTDQVADLNSAAVRNIRKTDSLLEEICSDHEMLLGELTKLAADEKGGDPRLTRDLLDSLYALEDEIRARLAQLQT